MRYCRNCRSLNPGDPAFCTSCGRSFGQKLCPSGHGNPRGARHCSICGSTELSSPHPRTRGFVRLLPVLLGAAFILAWSLYFTVFIRTLVGSPDRLLPLMVGGLGLSILFLIYVATVHVRR
jgi:hypothetical protein